jgi:hypothetical protein
MLHRLSTPYRNYFFQEIVWLSVDSRFYCIHSKWCTAGLFISYNKVSNFEISNSLTSEFSLSVALKAFL